MAPKSAEQATAYFCASGAAAVVNFPLWKASAMGQSGYTLHAKTMYGRMLESLQPPWRGVFAVMGGMTWARAAIFYGSDKGRHLLQAAGVGHSASIALPPLAISTCVQVVNMPLIRCSIMLQNPTATQTSLWQMGKHIVHKRGFFALWHGLSAGIFKTVPKYVTAVYVKEMMDEWLAPVDSTDRTAVLVRSAKKSVIAGLAGATLTNPLDVIRNTMFQTETSMFQTIKHLHAKKGWRFLYQGLGKNLVAVAVPVSLTIFLTDAFSRILA
ncbi:hypothetical protein PTSG_03639 [Salpingoeca rosetta]|uniref:Uncharacterized protein n=1 Tax=Salpingoeca rosetta (strain ATCC 50818 / BSB-021) TaxID=946362 RepID=F2U662_SALR5|nr:uncharacterized protein PTSG_03639 [Salpingoeca rosetta]EGD83003.1 hypothetical protein PTSG_03639 [Salpingoeca rosetta]|eukprot:XP_004995367.1 hypothetical protein PTSG_03639 [Salpingoeca rosetta]